MATHLELLDELTSSSHDKRLTDTTHPSDWKNPTPTEVYDTVVLGGGAAGLVAAGVVGVTGGRAAIIEAKWLGGDCTIAGCVPSKALLHAANTISDARAAEQAGWLRSVGKTDSAAVLESVRETRSTIAQADGTETMAKYGVDVYLGRGVFTSPNSIEVDGAELRFRTAIIATGSSPSFPPIEGLADAKPLTNATVFNLKEGPERLGVIGGGPIGCELGQAFARLGTKVTIFEGSQRLLPGQDPGSAAVVAEALEADGVQIEVEAMVESVSRAGSVTTVTTAAGSLEVDELLVATGRAPSVEGYGLDATGVSVEGGRIVVDSCLRTSVDHIFAIGDVALDLKFTHEAAASAQTAAMNSLLPKRLHRTFPVQMVYAIFTDPSIAHFSERGSVDGLEEHRVDLASVDRAVLSGAPQGWVSVYTLPGKAKIEAATVVGRHAEEVLSQLLIAKAGGRTITQLGSIKYPYPSLGMAFQHLATEWASDKLDGLAGEFTARLWKLRR